MQVIRFQSASRGRAFPLARKVFLIGSSGVVLLIVLACFRQPTPTQPPAAIVEAEQEQAVVGRRVEEIQRRIDREGTPAQIVVEFDEFQRSLRIQYRVEYPDYSLAMTYRHGDAAVLVMLDTRTSGYGPPQCVRFEALADATPLTFHETRTSTRYRSGGTDERITSNLSMANMQMIADANSFRMRVCGTVLTPRPLQLQVLKEFATRVLRIHSASWDGDAGANVIGRVDDPTARLGSNDAGDAQRSD